MDEGAEEALVADTSMGGGPQNQNVGGSGYQQWDEGAEDSPTAPATTGMHDPTFSGSNAIIDVDTFEDMRAARMARDAREAGGYVGYAGYRQGNPGINEFLQWEGQHSSFGKKGIDAIQGGYTPSRSLPGSVNLAPVGINVGYQGLGGYMSSGAISFDELDESTKAAVKAAGIQSQSEDETENAISQIFSAFQKILGQASKNTTNRQQGSMGPDQ